MSIKSRLLFVGVGQAGGNLCSQFEKKGYNVAYINTSAEDLRTLQTDSAKIFHIPTAAGCSKDKTKAKKYVQNNYVDLLSHIDDKFTNNDIIFFVFSAGGGTGAGMSPVLANILADRNEHKHYGAIVMMPSANESTVCLKNAAETYSEISFIRGIKSVFVLDNTKADKFEINRRFASRFDKFIKCAENIDTRGNIDGYEIETLLTSKGVSVILEGKRDNMNRYTLENDIYVDLQQGCGKVGVTVKSNVEDIQGIVENEIGIPEVYHQGFNDEADMVLITEMNWNDDIMMCYKDIVDERERRNVRTGAAILTNPFAKQKQDDMSDADVIPMSKIRTNSMKTSDVISKYF